MSSTPPLFSGTPASAASEPRRARQRHARILHVLPDLSIGGGQTIVLNHLRHADRSRFDIHVAQLTAGGELTEAFACSNGRPAIDIEHADGHHGRTVETIYRLMRRERIDLLHVHSDLDRRLGQLAALAARVPVVGHLHAEWVHLGPRTPSTDTPLRRARARAVASLRDAVERHTVHQYIAESARVRDVFRPLVRQPIAVLRQAIPLDLFDGLEQCRTTVRTSLGVAGDARLLICVSRLVAGKGHLALLDAFETLAPTYPDIHLVLVGDGDLRPDVEARARALGISPAVHFLGSRNDVPQLLGASDIFVFASETEGFGLVALEAMAASLPVVAFHLPALEEFVLPRTGTLVRGRDISRLAEAVRQYLDDPELARRSGAEGRRLVRDRFHPAAVATSFEVVYDEVLTGPTARLGEEAN